jgi:CRISPR-associated protein Cas2
MKVIVTYDVGVERIDNVRKLLKQYLSWIQNSVFEGEITISSLQQLQNRLTKIIDRDVDSILIYWVNNPSWLGKTVIGHEKGNTSNIL